MKPYHHLLTASLIAAVAPAQDPATTAAGSDSDPAPAAETSPQADTQKLEWPRDRERVVCRVAGKDATLEDLLRHVDERHYPDMLELMELPGARHDLQTAKAADWVRYYADVLALEGEARRRGVDFDAARVELGNALQRGFEEWLETYVEDRKKRGRSAELTQTTINQLLDRYQKDHGLRHEVQGWLDLLVPRPSEDDHPAILDYYHTNARWFGGRLTIAHVLVQDRDPRTLELLTGDAAKAALEKAADVTARLEKDGSNFEQVAQLLSDDRRTAKRGGRLRDLTRFDPRLPMPIVRRGWTLRDGQIAGPIRTRFGQHWIKRVAYKHLHYISTPLAIKDQIVDAMRQDEQERLLLDLRRKQNVQLRY